MEFTTPKWAQSNRLWQALSLVFGFLYLWERFDLGERLDLASLVPSGSAGGLVASTDAAASARCDCPSGTVFNSSTVARAPLPPLLAAPEQALVPPLHGHAAEEERLGRALGGSVSISNSSGNNSDNNGTAHHGGQHGALSGHDGHGSHATHPHVALFYLLTAILLGTIVLHLMTLPLFHGLQQTVILFILGLIHSAVFEGFNINDSIFGDSHKMWMQIDPHLLLFTMLPALLTGDAMTIDTSIARKVAQQCMYLAGPGVLMGSFGIAGFLNLYFKWDFLLCLCTGSILSATDPVAVVGLLKELGASPTLTVQIQGESLLNDGTAIVLYLLAFDSIMGVPYDAGDIIIFLVKMAMSALALGWVLGYIFLFWIRLSCKRLEHHAGLIQTTLTICCAYSSFCIAEGVLKISGVLCTVASSLVLADKMWPSIVEKQGLHQVWHMLEYLGNTIIFFLAGGLTGKVLVTIGWRDLLDLLLLYVVCTVVRGAILIGSRPILGYLNETKEPVSLQDAIIMTWGGLRGAVGLALAVQVNIGKIGNNITDDQANKVLFFVAGMACLTLLINATTCPALVRSLGVTRTPKAKQQILMSLHAQMQRQEHHKVNPRVVHRAIEELLQEAYHHIDKLVKDKGRASTQTKGPMLSEAAVYFLPRCCKSVTKKASLKVFKKGKNVPPSVHVNELLEAKKLVGTLAARKLRLLQVPKLPGEDYDVMLCETAKNVEFGELEGVMVHTMNEALLYLVRSHYWHLIETGEFVDGSTDSELLLHSVRLGIDQADKGQTDLLKLKSNLNLAHEKVIQARDHWQANTITEERVVNGETDMAHSQVKGNGQHSTVVTTTTTERHSRSSDRWSLFSGNHEHEPQRDAYGFARNTSIGKVLLVDFEKEETPLMRFANSIHFNIFMGIMILLNVIYIIVEQTDVSVNRNVTWGLELFFVSVFSIEFLIKLVAFRCNYFAQPWNIFDFALVIIGLIGLVFLGMMQGIEDGGTEQDMSQEARMFRINRVFRVLRIIRIFRLLNFARLLYAKLMKKEFCLELAEQLQSITVLKAFIKAHLNAQEKMLEYFGNNGKPQSPEVAVALIQSHTQVHKALYMAGKELEFVDPSIIKNVNIQRRVFVAAQELSDFVLEAHHQGVITARMAEVILHPVRDHMRVIDSLLSEVQSGMRGRHNNTKLTERSMSSDGVGDESRVKDDGFYDSEVEEGEEEEEEEESEEKLQVVDDGLPSISANVPCMPVRLGHVKHYKDEHHEVVNGDC